MKMLYGSGSLEKKLIEEEKRKTESLRKIRRYCKVCGTTSYIPKKEGLKHCRVCGNLIFYDEKAEFKYKLGKRLKNDKSRNTFKTS